MATNESLVFGGVELNDFTNFRIQAFDPGVAPKRWNWIQGADSDGAFPAEEADYDNAETTIRVRVTQQTTMDAALTKIGTLVDAIQEAGKQELGSPLVWTPAGSTKSLTGYVLGGEVTGLPIEMSGDDAGWFVRAPVLTIKLYRRPFWYGAEVTVGASTSTAPLIEYTVASVTGDVAAEGRLIVTDNATQSRSHLEWALEQRYYNAATSLILDSDSIVTSGFAGTGTTRTGAYDPGAAGNSVVRGTLTTTPLAICGTGNLSHVGTFRVKARVYANPIVASSIADDFKVRMTWKEGDGPLRSNDYVSPLVVAGWCEVDLGTVSIPEKTLGTQRWTGQVEAYSEAAGDTLDIDYLLFLPTAEGYGKARTPAALQAPTSFSARDEFDQVAGNLNAKLLPAGGTWTTSGDATDLAVEATGHTVQRSTTADVAGRTAVGGGTSLTDTLASIDFKWSALPSTSMASILWARSVHARAYVQAFSSTSQQFVIAVDTTTLAFRNVNLTAGSWYTLRLLVLANGMIAGSLAPVGSVGFTLASSDPRFATGGAYAAGAVSFQDSNVSATANTRNYDNFWAAVPVADAVVFSGRAAEIRHNEAIRQDSTGTYYGPIQTYRGSRFLLPCAGSANRTARLAVKARRVDIELAQDDQIADSTTVQVRYTPRFLAIPR